MVSGSAAGMQLILASKPRIQQDVHRDKLIPSARSKFHDRLETMVNFFMNPISRSHYTTYRDRGGRPSEVCEECQATVDPTCSFRVYGDIELASD